MRKREFAMRMQKKRSIDAMRCDHFEEFSECDANAKIDSHYQPGSHTCSISLNESNVKKKTGDINQSTEFCSTLSHWMVIDDPTDGLKIISQNATGVISWLWLKVHLSYLLSL